MRRLLRPLLILLALAFLFEAWLWSKLSPIVGWIVARIPFAAFKARFAAAVERLPPYPTLLVFLIPLTLLLPLKVFGFWLLHHHQLLASVAVFALAKVVSLGVTAFIFDITRPKLMQIAWFARFYDLVMRGLAWAHELTEPVKRRIKTWFRMFSPKRAGRTLKLMMRIRRRMRAARAAPA